MTRPPNDPDECVFLVRMRVERTRGQTLWRGSVHDVGAGLRRYVAIPGEIADFITIRLLARACDAADEPGP